MKLRFSRREFVRTTAALGATTALAVMGPEVDKAESIFVPKRWDKTADVVVVGAGATGLCASIEAAQNGASAILIEQNFDIGGHAIQSGSRVALGGGTSLQKKHGIEDSPDRMFSDLVNWPDYRFSDRDILRAFCDWSAPTFEWLVANGVEFHDTLDFADGGPQTVKRSQRALWTKGAGGQSPTGANGTALVRPLEARARKLGVEILLEGSLTSVIRESAFSGRVLGIMVANRGKTITIRAAKGVIIGTGGHTSNVNFRRSVRSKIDRGISSRRRTLFSPNRRW